MAHNGPQTSIFSQDRARIFHRVCFIVPLIRLTQPSGRTAREKTKVFFTGLVRVRVTFSRFFFLSFSIQHTETDAIALFSGNDSFVAVIYCFYVSEFIACDATNMESLDTLKTSAFHVSLVPLY